MPCRAPKSATTALQSLPFLWITDDVLDRAFHRFLRVSHFNCRHGSNVPGPLESHRRTAKRRNGLTAVAGGGAPPSQDLGALLGFKLEDAPRPDFERRWKWEAPTFGARPRSTSIWKDNGDWRPWMRPSADIEKSIVTEDKVEQFFAIPEDPVEQSRGRFEELLSACPADISTEENTLQPIFDFLQGSDNEPDARLTLRLVQWLGQRSLTVKDSHGLAAIVSQKIVLGTMHDDEQSAVLMELLGRKDATRLVSSTLDLLPSARLCTLADRMTAMASTAPTERVGMIHCWLAALRACSSTAQLPHSTNPMWARVYSQLSQHYSIPQLADHFYGLDEREIALVVLKHWVPQLAFHKVMAPKSAISMPEDIERRLRPTFHMEYTKDHVSHLVPNNALVDLVATLSAQSVPYGKLLQDILAYWQQTIDPESMLLRICELVYIEPKIDIPAATITPIIESLFQADSAKVAHRILKLLPAVSVGQYRSLLVRYIEEHRAHGEHIWTLVDRWAQEDGVSLHEKARLRKPLPQEITETVHNIASAWSKAPYLAARTAYRRVWECYCFLYDLHSPMSLEFSRTLIRAAVVNYINQRQPLSKDRVAFVLAVVERLEGQEVARQVDNMVYDYWRMHREATVYKTSKRVRLEKIGMHFSDDGTQSLRIWRPRPRLGKSPGWLRERELFEAAEPREIQEGVPVLPTGGHHRSSVQAHARTAADLEPRGSPISSQAHINEDVGSRGTIAFVPFDTPPSTTIENLESSTTTSNAAEISTSEAPVPVYPVTVVRRVEGWTLVQSCKPRNGLFHRRIQAWLARMAERDAFEVERSGLTSASEWTTGSAPPVRFVFHPELKSLLYQPPALRASDPGKSIHAPKSSSIASLIDRGAPTLQPLRTSERPFVARAATRHGMTFRPSRHDERAMGEPET